MKKQNEQKGTIALFVTVSMLLILAVTIIIYISINKKKIIQDKQINKIEENYNKKEDINGVYKNVVINNNNN